MALPFQVLIDYASAASGISNALPSVPVGASGLVNAIIRVDTGTVRWSETAGSPTVNPSFGLILSAADAAFRIDRPANFKFCAMGGAAAIQAVYYTYEGRGFVL